MYCYPSHQKKLKLFDGEIIREYLHAVTVNMS